MTRPNNSDIDQTLSKAGDGVCAVGPDGRIVMWNRAAEKIMGHSEREALGRPCCDVFVGFDDRGNRLCYRGCHVMTLVKLGEPVQSFDMQTRTKSGRPVWLNISILVVPAGPERSLTVHLFRDVTPTKELLTLVHERLARRPQREEPLSPLTRRELEILRLMATGANTHALAEKLHVSAATIRNHAQNIFGKLGVHSRLEAVAYATTRGLL
jgi:PAS domain S-box-containing protein